MIGLLLAGVAAGYANNWDERMAERQEAIETSRATQQEILENTKFVREVSLAGGPKPFHSLNLAGVGLGGLDLLGANFQDGNLAGASLSSADLTGSTLAGANLDAAQLNLADLSAATLGGASLVGANLSYADLTDVDLTDVDLTDAILDEIKIDWSQSGMCFNDRTVWPSGFTPPEDSECKRIVETHRGSN